MFIVVLLATKKTRNGITLKVNQQTERKAWYLLYNGAIKENKIMPISPRHYFQNVSLRESYERHFRLIYIK